MTERAAVRLLILDACVLIDYCEADQTVLGTVSASVGSIHVASTVFDEVDRLDLSGAAALGIQIVEPPLALLQAAEVKRGALSVQDHLCLLMAKTNGWTCVSNDTALRRAHVRARGRSGHVGTPDDGSGRAGGGSACIGGPGDRLAHS